jgi:hypothetical protein
MLAETMVGQDPVAISQGEDLSSIREMPGDVTGKASILFGIHTTVIELNLCRDSVSEGLQNPRDERAEWAAAQVG